MLWQWHAPELWRRFTIALQRRLAATVGLSVKRFRNGCKISYSKVVEFQARGLIHVHVPIRLDGPDGPAGPPMRLALGTRELEDAVRAAAAGVVLNTEALSDGTVYRVGWGTQVDCRSVSGAAERDGGGDTWAAHPGKVAAYLAKYLTKATEDFGLPERVGSAFHARSVGACPHAVRIIETALWLAGQGESYSRLSRCLATLAYRGHPITKSRAYSVTFGQLRRARRTFRRPRLDPEADVRQLLDEEVDVLDGFEVISSWVYVGRGYLDLEAAAAAVRSATAARARRSGMHFSAGSR